MTAAFTFAGTHRVDVRPLRRSDETGTLILRSDNPEIDGVHVECRYQVADYAIALIDLGDGAAVTLDDLGNVLSVQTEHGLCRVEYPKVV